MRGASVPEILICVALLGLVSSSGWQALGALRRERAAREAARGVAADLRRVGLAARTRGRAMAVEIDTARATWRVIVDGNGNGVSGAEIASGVDPVLADWAPLVREGAARLAVTRDLPAGANDAAVAEGSAPVRLGVVPRLVFTPRGTSGSGSIYVAGRDGQAYAIRVLGTTQRLRLQCLSPADVWEAC